MSRHDSSRLFSCALWSGIAMLFAVASPLDAAPSMWLTMYGTVNSVDPALQTKFHAGDPFQFGFTIDPAEIFDVTYGVRINARNLYFKVGSSYTATSSTDYHETYFHHDSAGNGPTGQGINFEKNNMTGPLVNGFPLSDTYLDLGLNDVFDTRQIREQQLLALNGQPIVNQDNSLSFDFSPNYKYVRFTVDSIVVALPEPSGVMLVLMAGLILKRRRARG